MTVALVYIAGPYRAATESRIRSNIERAREAAEVVWQCGAFALCPHLNTAWMGGVVPDGEFLRRDLAAMARCDAVLAIEGWKLSEGAKAEVAEAKRLKIPVFEDMLELRYWIRPRAYVPSEGGVA